MHGQVDQDVDFVSPDHLGELFVCKPGRASPLVGMDAKAFGKGVRVFQISVAEDLVMLVIVVREQGKGGGGGGVFTEVRRDVSDPQTPLGIVSILMKLKVSCQGPGMPLVPLPGLVADGPEVITGMIV